MFYSLKMVIQYRLIYVSFNLLSVTFIHIVVGSSNSFILVAVQYSIVLLSQLIYPLSFNGHLDFFSQFGAVRNTLVHVWCTYVTFLLSIYLGRKLSGYRMSKFSIFTRYWHVISQSVWKFQLLYTHKTLDTFWGFSVWVYFSHSCGCVV